MSGSSGDQTGALLDLIYDAALDPAKWALVLQELSATFHAHAILYMQDLRKGTTGLHMMQFVGFEESALLSYSAHYGQPGVNPWLQRMEKIAVGDLITEDRVFGPEPDYEDSEYQHDWLRPQRLYSALGSILVRDAGLTTTLSLNRYADAGSASASELETFSLLIPHLRRAVQIHREFALSNASGGAVDQGLERLALAAFLVDADSKVMLSNRRGLRLLRAGDGLTAIGSVLGGSTPHASDALRALVRNAALTAAGRGQSAGNVLMLPRQRGKALTALIAPASSRAIGSGLPLALVLVRDPTAPVTGRAEALRALFNLTSAEAHVVSRFADGEAINTQAEMSNTSLHTLRLHLKRAMSKMDVHRQTELFSVVERSVASMAQNSND